VPLPPLVRLPAAGAPDAGRRERASRHALLPGVGDDGVRRLAAARVLVIGAGGLGSPVIQYLAAAGVGALGVVDDDAVDLSNLQRQVVHRTADIGERKTASAARFVAELDPAIEVTEYPVRLTRENALDVLAGWDLVVDGSDTFATRYLVSDAAALAGVPCVWGSVLRFDGQVTVFWDAAPDGRGLDYRDLHPVPPAPGEVLSCGEAGVLGALCGTIGSMMAAEAVKLVTGVGEPLLGRVQTLDALTGRWRELPLRRAADRRRVTELIDYDAFCGARTPAVPELGAADLDGFDGALLDVREPEEHEAGHIPGDRLLPLADLLADPDAAGGAPLVAYCRTGVRSARAVEALRAAGIDARSLRGGYEAWRRERAGAPAR